MGRWECGNVGRWGVGEVGMWECGEVGRWGGVTDIHTYVHTFRQTYRVLDEAGSREALAPNNS